MPRQHAGEDLETQILFVAQAVGASLEDSVQKLQYDLFYIKNLSIPLDLFILFETVKTVLLRRGA